MREEYDYCEAKKRWHEICSSDEYYMPIYHRDWYWDAVSKNSDDWKVIVYEKNGIIGAFPFSYRRVHGLGLIGNLWQVSRGGIWIHFDREYSLEKKVQINKEIVDYIIERLPIYDFFNVRFLAEYDNCLPLYWNGFTTTVTYNSYILNRGVENVKSSCSKKRRQRINTAQDKYTIRKNFISIKQYWDFFNICYKERNEKISFEEERFTTFLECVQEKDSIIIKSAHDENDSLMAAAVYLEDDRSIYHQFCVNKFESNDAQSLLTYDTICEAMIKGKKFDFEGSMIKGVAEYNASFQPEIETCYVVQKSSGKFDLYTKISSIIKKR